MATITPTQSLNTGVTPLTWASVFTGDVLVNNGRTILVLRETAGAGTLTVTADTPALVNGLTIQNPSVVVPSSGYAVIGPFDPSLFNTASGQVALTYSGAGEATTQYLAISV
jgi:hypothetical protein